MARVATCAGNVVGCRSPRGRRQVTDVPDLVHPTSDLLGALGAAPCRRHTGQPRLGFPQGYLKPRRRQIPQRRSAVRVEGNLSAGLTWCLDTDKSQLGRMYASHRPQQSTPVTRRSSLRRVTEPTPPPSQANQPPVLCCLGHWPSPPTLRRLNRCIWPPGQPFALPDQAGGQLVTRRRLLERCDPRDCMCSCMYPNCHLWAGGRKLSVGSAIIHGLSVPGQNGRQIALGNAIRWPTRSWQPKPSGADAKEEWTN